MRKTLKYNLKVAVVILNYNGLEHLQNYLNSIIKHLPEFAKLYVADNGSTDESLEFLRRYEKDLTVLELKHNTGYAGGYNNALGANRGGVLLSDKFRCGIPRRRTQCDGGFSGS